MLKKQDNLIYGIRPLIETIKAGKEIDKVLIQKGLPGEHFAELFVLLKAYEIHYQLVPVEKLNRITRKNHQGVLAFISAIAYQPIEEIIQSLFEQGKNPLILILDRITDVRNFGAIVRTAECAGVHAILVPLQSSAQMNADAMKTSAGALNNIPVSRSKNLSDSIDFLKNSGLQIVAATEKSKENYYSVDFSIPTAIILGSEEDGVSPAYLQKSSFKVRIPLSGATGSLNVSVAAGILIYEAVKQRTLALE
jgi:23S rRNA (guanosine2251-2'-O)-methyltransferase